MSEIMIDILEALIKKLPMLIQKDLQRVNDLTTRRIEYVDKIASSLNKLIILKKRLYELKQLENLQQSSNIISEKDKAIMENYLKSQLKHLNNKIAGDNGDFIA